MQRTKSPIDCLFPKIRQTVLATTLLAPERGWYMRELAARVGVTSSSLQRELDGLTKAGILKRTTSGNRTYFQADRESPLFPELQGLLKKTVGGADEIKRALEPLAAQIEVAFIYGSFATQTEVRNSSDIDLMVIGEVTGRGLTDALAPAERALGREINLTLYTSAEFKSKLAQGNHFLTTVAASAKLPIIGDMDVLAAITN